MDVVALQQQFQNDPRLTRRARKPTLRLSPTHTKVPRTGTDRIAERSIGYLPSLSLKTTLLATKEGTLFSLHHGTYRVDLFGLFLHGKYEEVDQAILTGVVEGYSDFQVLTCIPRDFGCSILLDCKRNLLPKTHQDFLKHVVQVSEQVLYSIPPNGKTPIGTSWDSEQHFPSRRHVAEEAY